MTGFDFDTAVEGAWRDFRNHLADRLSALPMGERFSVEQARDFPEGTHAVLEFTVTRAHRMRCTAHVLDLHPTVEFKLEQLTTMTDAGWRLLRDNRLIYEVGQRRVDGLAQIAVDALRVIWEVVHPAFLSGSGPTPDRREARVAVGAIPESRDHLLGMVIDTLEGIAGRYIAVDEDGDIPLPTGALPSWLRVLDDEASVEFFGTLVDEVPDTTAAAEFVAGESVRWAGVKLIVHQSTLMAFLSVGMSAYHRENLIAALGRWLGFMKDVAPEIISAVTGVDAPEHSETDKRLPDPLQTLIVLDPDGTTLNAHEVAKICRYDQSEILRYIYTTQEQYLAWVKSAGEADDADDPDEAAACRHEGEVWQMTTNKLQEALRLVVLRDAGGPPQSTPDNQVKESR
ncbi:hypothetical protein GTV32_16215 [Gordonia sp. SID5947]|uniref:TY-Chap domain-containing protein n=1 Tax=Gordonia sp. SID5947 TaxID=2690315 RepID=UPI001371BAED|nr:hypothetical protein [Gordonia sp. SID5947]MYR07750.1 hypothetical protein [Gordonia sp. SID5947]